MRFISLMVQRMGLEDDCYVEMLDYTIDLFESQGLRTVIITDTTISITNLEVTYVSLLAMHIKKESNFH